MNQRWRLFALATVTLGLGVIAQVWRPDPAHSEASCSLHAIELETILLGPDTTPNPKRISVQALSDMQACVDRHPALRDCHVAGAMALVNLQNWPSLMTWVDRALLRWPGDTWFRTAKGLALLAANHPSEALKWLPTREGLCNLDSPEARFQCSATAGGCTAALVALGRLQEARQFSLGHEGRDSYDNSDSYQRCQWFWEWVGRADSAKKYQRIQDSLRHHGEAIRQRAEDSVWKSEETSRFPIQGRKARPPRATTGGAVRP